MRHLGRKRGIGRHGVSFDDGYGYESDLHDAVRARGFFDEPRSVVIGNPCFIDLLARAKQLDDKSTSHFYNISRKIAKLALHLENL